MTWEFALIIGLVAGLIIGVLIMRFGSSKLRNQQSLQEELEKNKAELEQYKQGLMSHFERSAQLLENVADDYRQLCQHMAESSTALLPEITQQLNSLNFLPSEHEKKALPPTEEPPRDYSNNASGLLRSENRD